MIQQAWTVLCSRYIENKKTNNISLIESLERLTVTVPPDHPNRFFLGIDHVVVSMLYNSDSKNEASAFFRLIIIDPSGTENIQANGKISDLEPLAVHRLYGSMPQIELNGEGVYFFRVDINNVDEVSPEWETGTPVPLDVRYKVQEGAPMVEIPVMAEAQDDK